jgi:hypothetical protein
MWVESKSLLKTENINNKIIFIVLTGEARMNFTGCFPGDGRRGGGWASGGEAREVGGEGAGEGGRSPRSEFLSCNIIYTVTSQ